MASSKVFEIAFKIKGQIEKSFSNGFKNANKQLNDMNKKSADLKKNMESLQKVAAGGLAIGGAGLAGFGMMAKEAMNAESAFADFKKVFSGTEKELANFQKEFLKISSETGKSFVEISTIAAAAAQSGIKSADITAFTNDAVKMAIAFDITADQAGQSMAEMRTAFKMSQDEVRELADKINSLGNTTPQAAAKIMEITQRVGPLANLANISAENVAALGSSMVALEPDVAATAIKKVISSMTAGTSASKSMQAAYKELGLDSEKVSKSVQKDSTKTMLTILNAINKLPKDKQAANLSNIFGLEGIGGTSQIVDNMGNLIKNLEAVADANKNGPDGWGGSMIKEYEARAATTENAMNRARESMRNVGIVIGSTMLPYITQASDKIKEIALRVSEWMEKNPELTAQLSKWGVIIAAVIAGVSALSIGLITFIGPIMMVVGAISKFGLVITIIKAVGTAFLWLGRIFLMNPIGLVITAIIAVIYLLWANWDMVSKWIAGAWDYIKEKGNNLLSWFAGLPSKFVEFGRNLLQGLANGIRNGVSAAVNAAGEAVEAVKNKVKDFFGIHSPSRVFAEFGMYNMQGLANGMTDNAGVAEKASLSAVSGALPTGSSLTSNNSSSSSQYNITLNLTGGNNDTATQAKTGLIDAVKQLEAQQRKDMRTSFA